VGPHEYEYEEYDCGKIRATVTLEIDVLSRRNARTGRMEEIRRAAVDCDHTEECGVAIRSGTAIDYDWPHCIHPQLQRSSSTE
jgi:hypothetical protein